MTVQQSPATDGVALTLADDHLALGGKSRPARYHYVWLRDNCWCAQCRVMQTGERRLYTAHIPADIAPLEASLNEGSTELTVTWTDGHVSRYSMAWLAANDYSHQPEAPQEQVTLWTSSLPALPRFDHAEVVGEPRVQLAYLDAVREFGAAVVCGTPSADHEVERFAETIGHVRETAFERVHNVRNDPLGYNVAHTPLELKPHTDLPSYHWPPSIQLLHFLVNEATGGESTLVDGWSVLADLRRQHPDAFDTLCRVPVTFQLFSADEDTKATAPVVQLDPSGRVRTLRFSNQLALPLRADFDEVGAFYEAYRLLGQMLDSPEYKLVFKTHTGDLLTVHSHRVLHGRLAFDPASGARHLQDVYMEYDDLMARRRVLAGTHKPAPSTGGELA
ncbi:MAG: TauD/TfdA family dioxygenase [Actinomycetota bacterium]|nr:TauD/TfdA family dioxygenase [Actinomycetota bacterium]MDH5279212.1 TauD/TfdA family dioxygenase [Actinomycetota bacterium]